MSENGLLKDLAVGSILTGQISEIHIRNMKTYPFVFLDSVSGLEISYDIVTDPTNSMPGKKSTIIYTVEFTDNKVPDSLADGAKNLHKALSTLFSHKIQLLIKDRHGQILVEENGK